MISTIIRGWLSDQDSPLALKFKLRLYGSERTRVDWLEKEDCQRVLDSIDPNVPNESILICGALLCGLRRVEMLRMTVADAEEAVRTKKLRVVGKCHKIRPIPIGEGYRSILRDYLRTRTDAGKNDRLLTCRFRKRTGIQFYGYHTLRRSYLRMLWKEKVPIETLAQLAGHESTDMTKEYIGVNMDDMTGAIQLLPVEIRTKPMTAR
jgi:integrase